jgi:hypothetical protein
MDQEVVITGAAAVIALAALVLAVVEAHQNRKHHRLSVLPRLCGDFQITPTREFAAITVANRGLGPAIIFEFTMRVDGKLPQDHQIVRFEALTRFIGIDEIVTYVYFQKGEVLPAGEMRNLVSAPIGTWSSERSEMFRTAFRRLRFELTYGSFYGEKFTLTLDGSEVYPAEANSPEHR